LTYDLDIQLASRGCQLAHACVCLGVCIAPVETGVTGGEAAGTSGDVGDVGDVAGRGDV